MDNTNTPQTQNDLKSSNSSIGFWVKALLISLCVVVIVVNGALKLYGAVISPSDTYGDTFTGYKPVIVVSGSMLPAIQINSLNLVKSCTAEDLNIGDIVMYYDNERNMLITHRLKSIERIFGDQKLIVQGDNNEYEDNPVDFSQVRGKIVFTWNGIAPLLTDILPSNGAFNAVGIIRAIAIITLVCSAITYIIQYILRILNAVYYKSYDNRVYINSLRDYKQHCLDELERVEDELKTAQSSPEHSISLHEYLRRAKVTKFIKDVSNSALKNSDSTHNNI